MTKGPVITRVPESEAVAAEVGETFVKTYGPDDMLSRVAASRYLGLDGANTLAQWAARDYGPRWVKYGNGRTARVMYRRRWLDDFIEACAAAERISYPSTEKKPSEAA